MIPTPCLGAGRAPWAYALGWDSLGEGVPRLRSLGLPPVKTQYIIQSLSQKKIYSVNNSKEDAKISEWERVEPTRTVSVLFSFLIDRACWVVNVLIQAQTVHHPLG